MSNFRLWAMILFLYPIFMPVVVLPDDLPPKEELCPDSDCRGPITIKLIKKDGTIFERKHDYLFPIIQSNGISIVAGEDIKITGTFDNNKLINIRSLKESNPETPLLSFRFWQEDKDRMMLKVVNNSKYNIKYHLNMIPLDQETFVKTSSCPVLAGKLAYELWPYPILQLFIPEIFVVEIDDQLTCEY